MPQRAEVVLSVEERDVLERWARRPNVGWVHYPNLDEALTPEAARALALLCRAARRSPITLPLLPGSLTPSTTVGMLAGPRSSVHLL
jgi:hypothetical protein